MELAFCLSQSISHQVAINHAQHCYYSQHAEHNPLQYPEKPPSHSLISRSILTFNEPPEPQSDERTVWRNTDNYCRRKPCAFVFGRVSRNFNPGLTTATKFNH